MDLIVPFITFLHLFFVENRGALIVPLATKSMLTDVTLRLTLHDKSLSGQFERLEKNKPIGEIYDGLEVSIGAYMRTYPWNTKFISDDGLIRYKFAGLLPLITWVLVAWVIAFTVGLLYYMWSYGISDWSTGKYLNFCYKLEKLRFYRIMVEGLMHVSIFLFIGFNVFLWMDVGSSMYTTVSGNLLLNFIVWLFGLNALRSGYDPAFEWRSSEFKNLKFQRPISMSTLLCTNDTFAHELQAALIKVKRCNLDVARRSVLVGSDSKDDCDKHVDVALHQLADLKVVSTLMDPDEYDVTTGAKVKEHMACEDMEAAAEPDQTVGYCYQTLLTSSQEVCSSRHKGAK